VNLASGRARLVCPCAARIYWSLTLGVLAIGVLLVITFTPTDPGMGPVQRLMYVHVPAAAAAFFAAFVTFLANTAYIWSRSRIWDALARDSARATVGASAVVLMTGAIWGRFVWGVWWTWSPRLTFTLVLLALYVIYLVLRRTLHPYPRRAMVCALYGAVAFIDVPLVYMSARLLPDVHPTSLPLTYEMRVTLWVCIAFGTMTTLGLILSPTLRHLRRVGNMRLVRRAHAAPV